MEGWTLVYSGNRIQEVEFIKELLEENDILSVIVNKHDSVYLIGDIELYVPFDDAFGASQLINSLESE
mgnify:FL=1|jgi:hypothetical protein